MIRKTNGETSMFGWYRELTGREKRTLWACAGGWGLDGMDVQIYSFLIPTLISIWGISQAQAGALGTAALISSAIGGWGTGMLADRFGRVRMLQISICWYAGFTFLSGFTTSYDQLLVTRTLQGIGFGGEWAAGSVLMGEMIRPAHRGKAVGCVQSAFAVGWGCAAVLSTGFFALLPAAWAWRALFWAGLAPALLILFVRRHVRESEVFETARSDAAARGTEAPLTAIFGPGLLRTTVLASLLALGVQGSSYAVITWLPTYLRTVRHLSATGSGSYVMVVTLGAFCGYITSAYLTDAVGRRRNFLIYAIGCWVIDFTYMYAPGGQWRDPAAGLPVRLLHAGNLRLGRPLLHRVVSDPRAGQRTGLRLQLRTLRRRLLRAFHWPDERGDAARSGDRRVVAGRLRADVGRGVPAAGNEGFGPDGARWTGAPIEQAFTRRRGRGFQQAVSEQ